MLTIPKKIFIYCFFLSNKYVYFRTIFENILLFNIINKNIRQLLYQINVLRFVKKQILKRYLKIVCDIFIKVNKHIY